jgi:hypothetical protein
MKGREDIGLVGETQLKEVIGCMFFGLVCLNMKGVLQ